MAMNTYKTFLLNGTGTGTLTYAEICPIKDYPDFLNEVNTIDVTSLENANHTYIFGLGRRDLLCACQGTHECVWRQGASRNQPLRHRQFQYADYRDGRP